MALKGIKSCDTVGGWEQTALGSALVKQTVLELMIECVKKS